MNLGEIWGSKEDRPGYNGIWLNRTFKEDVLIVHQYMVNINELVEPSKAQVNWRNYLSLVPGALKAVLNLDITWFETRPANANKIRRLAEVIFEIDEGREALALMSQKGRILKGFEN